MVLHWPISFQSNSFKKITKTKKKNYKVDFQSYESFCNLFITSLLLVNFGPSAGWFWRKKPKQGCGKFFFFPAFKFFIISFCTWKNPTHWGLETAVCPIFAKPPVLDIFAVCSLVPRINLSHTQQGYLCQKNQSYSLGKADLGFFLSNGSTTIKITIFNTFYTSFSSCYRWNSCKKYRLFQ